MKEPIKVLVRRTEQKPTVETIENTLKAMQEIVGGRIEMPHNPDFSKSLQIVCNEEGKFVYDPKPNVYWGDYDIIYGDILFVGKGNNGECKSLTPKQINEAMAWIDNNDASGVSGAGAEDLAEKIVKVYTDFNDPSRKGKSNDYEM